MVITSVILLPLTSMLSYGRSPRGLLPTAFNLPPSSLMTTVDLVSPSGEMVVSSQVPMALLFCANTGDDISTTTNDATSRFDHEQCSFKNSTTTCSAK